MTSDSVPTVIEINLNSNKIYTLIIFLENVTKSYIFRKFLLN